MDSMKKAISFRRKLEFIKRGQFGEESNHAVADYNEIRLSSREWMGTVLLGAGLSGGVAWIFYRHPFAVLAFACAGFAFPAIRRKQLLLKRKAQLKIQFKQLLSAISSSLSAGRSVESAIRESLNDLRLLYPDASALIIRELEMMVRRMDNGESIESAFIGFARRAHVEEISQFADIFVICKRTGGNLVQVVRRTTLLIQEKLDIDQDLQVLLAQKKFESKVLAVAPVVFVAVMAWSAPDYMLPLYEGTGHLIMTGSLLLLWICRLWIQTIMDIKV
ncbi:MULTISPECIES: type II secretion system F family protein [Paenibacillus]|uniref:Pilus assembly protein TadB n=1 Tax=Paenibacillus validus TaxID=44253 RepID=A0A7X2Z7B2_9BACL|nr:MULTISPECIES: type II secretion system F family protein [Paenibacillus]MUG69618.1 pilus assembly protein TadB [Paenibacillus validus]